jgi:hypothetical protein
MGRGAFRSDNFHGTATAAQNSEQRTAGILPAKLAWFYTLSFSVSERYPL